jgi:hypothetical protein
MDPADPLPFGPGKSPFHVKGIAYRSHLEYTDRHLPGGMRAAAELLSPEVRAYVEQPFLASSWYDVFPYVALGAASARLAGMTHLAFVRQRAVVQASEDIRGAYRLLLWVTSPQTVAQRLVRIVGRYFDYGQAEIVRSERGHVEAVRKRVPEPLAAYLPAVAEPYADTALRAAGAKNVVARARPPERDGELHGLPTVSVRFDMRWE